MPHKGLGVEHIDLTIFVPCYNEEPLVVKTLETIRQAASSFTFAYEVFVYDDASTDRTVEVARRFIQEQNLEGQFQVVENASNQGIGINYFRAAERGRGDYFLVVFGDHAEPAEALRRLFNLMGKADVIIPHFDTRLLDLRLNGDNRALPRRLISLLFAWIIRTISGHNIRYFNGPVIHRRSNVLKQQRPTFGLGYQAELLCRILNQPGISYLEVKVFNNDRVAGMPTAFKPKNIVSVLGSMWRILRERPFGRTPLVALEGETPSDDLLTHPAPQDEPCSSPGQ